MVCRVAEPAPRSSARLGGGEQSARGVVLLHYLDRLMETEFLVHLAIGRAGVEENLQSVAQRVEERHRPTLAVRRLKR